MGSNNLIQIIEDISIRSNQSSFNIFFHRYCTKLYTFSFQITSDKLISEEVVSDVFTKLWNNRKNLQKIENIEAYLYRATRNQSLSAIRNSDKVLTYTQITPEVFITNVSPETSLLDSELEKLIRDNVDNMPKAQQMVFKLIKNDGLKYREVAEILDISESTVETQMVRALKKLRVLISEYMYQKNPLPLRKSN